ncbi:diguanylate cyclase domain-containing protein [Aquidulcibacter sp.]|uniref:diguanylate cyclase domain-containing protein n=1 Tax=Aquidulcibacter sp. TaxID=2052990 RepID=UPI0028AC2DE4|nr:diguanylate cyclase [Aquidulcibacter sp.]
MRFLKALPTGLIRILFACIFAAIVAIGLSKTEVPQRVESALADHWQFRDAVAPSEDTIIIFIDEKAVQTMGYYPFDRRLMAKTLAILNQAEVDRIYIDAGLSVPESEVDDLELENALAALGPKKLALPVSQIENPDRTYRLIQPLGRFSRHTTLVTSIFGIDGQQKLRTVSGLPDEKLALSADWLNRRPDLRAGELPLNFQISVPKFKRYAFLDVAAGRISPSALRGKKVIIGLSLKTPQFTLIAPNQGPIVRAEAIALATETANTNFARHQWTPVGQVGLVLAATLLATLIIYRLSWGRGLLATIVLVVCWFPIAQYLWITQKIQIPILTPAFGFLLTWQILKLDESFLGQLALRVRKSLFGVGQNALLAAAEVVAEPAIVFNSSGLLLGANEAFKALRSAQLTSEEARNLPGHLDALFLSADKLLALPEAKQATGHIDVQFKHSNQEFEASVRWVRSITSSIAIASLKDVTESRQRERALSQLAYKDVLTGVGNRTAFQVQLKSMTESAASQPFAALVIDLDGFKAINDEYGHHAGDQLLVKIAERISSLLRPQDFVARIGGDEFTILYPSGELEAVEIFTDRLIRAILEPVEIDAGTVRVGASVGVALCPMHHYDGPTVVKMADAAMYVAKRQKPAFAIHGMAEPQLCGHQQVAL